jgi:hypothetical protein
MPAGHERRLCDHDRAAGSAPSRWTNDADLLNEGSGGSEVINADVDVTATNNNSLCGPVPSGTMGSFALYYLDEPVSFDP